MNVDILTVHPRNHDYPVWRSMLERFAPYYNRAIVAFTGTGSPDFSSFIQDAVIKNKTIFVNSRHPAGDEDWRNVAVHAALGQSSAEWVWFLEQDFFFKSKSFIEKLFQATYSYDAIGFWEANRLHPACLLIKRSLIDKTNKYFGTIAGKLDHFGSFSQDIVAQLGKDSIGELHNLDLLSQRDWFHMQGLTHNFNLCRMNDTDKIYKRDEFLTYVRYAPKIAISQSADFISECQTIQALLGAIPDNPKLKEFLEPLL